MNEVRSTQLLRTTTPHPMTANELAALTPGTTVYCPGSDRVNAFQYAGPVPCCPGYFILQSVRYGTVTPNVFSVNGLDLADYTTDKQAALAEVEPKLAMKLQNVRSEMIANTPEAP